MNRLSPIVGSKVSGLGLDLGLSECVEPIK